MLVGCGNVIISANEIPVLMIEQIVSVDRVHMEAAQLKAYTDFACELASLAATQILPYFRTGVDVENKGDSRASMSDSQIPDVTVPDSTKPPVNAFDPVTIADKNAEMVMRKKIRDSFPDHGILGEECGLHVGESGLTWVLDPIDGTRAFITGLPMWGCLIALFDGVEPVLGVMDQPFLGERYIGTANTTHCLESRNFAARVEGNKRRVDSRQELKTRDCTDLNDAVMMTTSPDMFKSKDEQSAFYRLAAAVRMHRFGGDCYAYCMLARGFVDLVVEAELQPYDIQALIPIVEGAGGVISNWQGESARAGGQIVAAATPELHRQVLARLRGTG